MSNPKEHHKDPAKTEPKSRPQGEQPIDNKYSPLPRTGEELQEEIESNKNLPPEKGPIPHVADMPDPNPLPIGKTETEFERREEPVRRGELVTHPADLPAPKTHVGAVVEPPDEPVVKPFDPPKKADDGKKTDTKK